MSQMFEFIVPNGSDDRADKVLAHAFPQTSRTLIKQAIEGRYLPEDGSNIEPKTKLCGKSLTLNPSLCKTIRSV